MAELASYDGVALTELAARTGSPRMVAFDSVGSTMDKAHELARAGAQHGTVVLAGVQTAGRGRERREWRSDAGGVWLTLVAREADARNIGALPLRIGIAAAYALESLTSEAVGLKWPNDLFLGDGKLGGVLVEARWRGEQLDWAAVGIGINLAAPDGVGAAGLGESVRRGEVVERLVPAVLAACSRAGVLTAAELSEFAARDIAWGREISEPLAGVVAGIDESGALLVESAGTVHHIRSGSLVFAVEPQSLSANR
ncbi:MAG TPA: biotin--[acetyl-CoA-carboxylase] ligase [Gemmatimonadaceae bacterium]